MFGVGKLKKVIGTREDWDNWYANSIFSELGRFHRRIVILEEGRGDAVTLSRVEYSAFKQIMRERFGCHKCLDGSIGPYKEFCNLCGSEITQETQGDSMAKKKSKAPKRGGMKKGGC